MPKKLEGYIGDSAGLPLNGLTTTVTKVADGSAVTSGATNSAGLWAFTGLSATDEYFVKTVDAAGRAVVRGPWSGEMREVWVRDRLEMPAAGVAALGVVTVAGTLGVTGATTMTGALAINAASGVPLTLRNGAATDNVQLRFKGNASAVDQWAIGNEVLTNAVGRNFDIYDVVAGANRLRIDSSGLVSIPKYLSVGGSQLLANITVKGEPTYGGAIMLLDGNANNGYITGAGTDGTYTISRYVSGAYTLNMTIKPDGRVTITPPSGGASSGLTIVEPGANDASIALTSATAPRNWLVGVEGTRGASTVGTAGSFFVHDATAGLSRLSINTSGDTRIWGNLTVDPTKQLSFANEVKDDKIVLYSGYSLGIRGGTMGYFVAASSEHNFYVNNVSKFVVGGSVITIPNSILQYIDYAYFSGPGGPTYPAMQPAGAMSWNFTNGSRDISIWNCDLNNSTASGNPSFVFRQLTGTSTRTDLLTVAANGRITQNMYVSSGMAFLIYNSPFTTNMFGIEHDGALRFYTLGTAFGGSGVNTWGTAPVQARLRLTIKDHNGGVVGYVPIYT